MSTCPQSSFTRRQILLSALAIPWPSAAFEPLYSDHNDLFYYLTDKGERRAVRSRRDFEIRRRHILAAMQEVMGPLPSAPPTKPRLETRAQSDEGSYWRRQVRFEAEPDDWVPAWLLVPKKPNGAAVLCLHQTTKFGKDEPAGVSGKSNLHYARELAERGFITLAPDYPNFGEYRFDPYSRGYASATMKGIVNHRRGVDVLLNLGPVKPRRLGVCGHSLGGHNSLFVAAFDTRIQAVVTSCGFTAFPKYYGGDLTGWSHRGYMPRIAERYSKSPAKMPFDFPEILAIIAPRAIFINAPTQDSNFDRDGVEDCVRAARPVFERLYNRPDALVVEHPETGHDFPPAVRERAYRFLERFLLSR
ncbi:MAG: prolyl oligopeptidase family serine peptidase [Bryobacteraceae bacterium]|nr:prolyl oligopeptidase family serine peptidase [Bryobacteraceae bacterium]MDW8378191.1 prolyl oligopeptidase family serine peptidase [Bryobacterales bacterium]